MPTLTRTAFGTTRGGDPVALFSLRAGCGVEVGLISHGGIVTRIMVPDRAGHAANVVLGFGSLAEYEAHNRARGLFFGALIGRYANRLAGGRFTLDGVTHQVPCNDGPNSLHGGAHGFDDRVWSVDAVIEAPDRVGVALRLVSDDGDQGFPGRLDTTVTYALDATGRLSIDYEARTDRATVVNLTHHGYFNLAGPGAQNGVLDQVLQIPAARYTPVDDTLIPTGARDPVAGTPFDFRTPKTIGRDLRQPHPQLRRARGYDHNWVLDGAGDEAGGAALHHAATLWDPASGRFLRIETTEPGLQFYSGNFLDGTVAGDVVFRQSDAVALETQHFPDSPNHPGFPSTRLDPGQVLRSRTCLQFGASADWPGVCRP